MITGNAEVLFVVFDLVVVFLILWVQVYLDLAVSAKVVMLLFLPEQRLQFMA